MTRPVDPEAPADVSRDEFAEAEADYVDDLERPPATEADEADVVDQRWAVVEQPDDDDYRD
jgi:hypothetical protein